MILAALTLTALAAPPDGYRVTKEVNDCQLMLGAAVDGVVPMRAECVWPEVDPARFRAVMGQFQDHDVVWSTVSSCEIVRTEAGRTLTHQVHVSKGISDREALLWLEGAEVPGGWRASWTLATDPLDVADGNVPVAKDDGYVEVLDRAQGGALVNYQLTYDPGGSVPGFIVRWFQVSGLQTITEDLRAAVR